MPDVSDPETNSRCWACSGWGNVVLCSSTATSDNACWTFQEILRFWYLAFFWTGTHLRVLQEKKKNTLFLLFWNISCQQNWRVFLLRGTLKSYFLLQYMITSINRIKARHGSNFKMKEANEHIIWMSWLFCLNENLHWEIKKKKKIGQNELTSCF